MTTPDTDTRPDGTDPNTSVDQMPTETTDAGLELTTPEGVQPPNVAGAVETVASHLHPTPSWDLEQHPEPIGREEVWRFTPMKRIRPLLQAVATSDNLDWETSLPSGVSLSPIDPERARALYGRGLAKAAKGERPAGLADMSAGSGIQPDIASEFAKYGIR